MEVLGERTAVESRVLLGSAHLASGTVPEDTSPVLGQFSLIRDKIRGEVPSQGAMWTSLLGGTEGGSAT